MSDGIEQLSKHAESRGNDVSLFGDAYHQALISGHCKAVEYITNRFVIIYKQIYITTRFMFFSLLELENTNVNNNVLGYVTVQYVLSLAF